MSGAIAKGRIETEVAVIGAGVAGLSTAFHLNELNIETVVLESGRPGDGATGASGGIVAPEFARGGIARASRLHGERNGARLARMIGRSAAFTFELIERHDLECGASQSGFVSPARSARDMELIWQDAVTWQSMGFPVQVLDANETRDLIGSDFYRGALHFEHGGILDPLAYASSLARLVERRGVPVFVESPVHGIERRKGGWLVQLPNAQVLANRIVLAANGGNAELHPSLRQTTLPLLVHEYATAPLSTEVRSACLGRGVPFTDQQSYVFTSRLSGDNRLISAIPELLPKWDRARFEAEARGRFRAIHAMDIPAIEFIWSGTVRLNPSLLPAVYLPEGDTDLIAIQACNGRGLGVNSILGSEVAEMVASGNPEATSVPPQLPRKVALHRVAANLPGLVMSLARLKDTWGRSGPASPCAVEPGP